MTVSVALLLAFPVAKPTVPLMSRLVSLRVSLWTVPWLSRRIRGPCWRASPFRVHSGGLDTARETSHWNSAWSGAATSTSVRSVTINRAWAVITIIITIEMISIIIITKIIKIVMILIIIVMKIIMVIYVC